MRRTGLMLCIYPIDKFYIGRHKSSKNRTRFPFDMDYSVSLTMREVSHVCMNVLNDFEVPELAMYDS